MLKLNKNRVLVWLSIARVVLSESYAQKLTSPRVKHYI